MLVSGAPTAKLAGIVAYGATVKPSERVRVTGGEAVSLKVSPMVCVEFEARRLAGA